MNPFISRDSRDKKFYYFYEGDDGKTKRKCLGTTEEEQAKEVVKDILNVFQKNPHSKEIGLKLSELQKIVVNYAMVNFTSGTVDIYKKSFRNMIHLFKDTLIKNITMMDIEKYKSIRIQSVKPATTNIEVRNIKTIFNLAIRFGHLDVNPAKEVKQFSEVQKEIQFFSEEQFNQLINVVENKNHKLLFQLGYHTGCRLGELLNLELSNIDLKTRVINIINTPTFKTKTGKIRQIPINDKLNDVLKSHELRTNGKLIDIKHPHSVSKIFKTNLKKAGLPSHFHFHHLRHTFITHLLKKGVSIYKVKRLAGHSNIKTTEGYAHLLVDDLRDAVNVL